MPTRNENSVASGTVHTQCQRQQNGCAGPRRAGKNCGNELPESNGDDDGPGDFILQWFAAQPEFNRDEKNSAGKQSPGDRRKFLRQFEFHFLEDQATDAGEDEGRQNFQQVVLGSRFAPSEHELFQPLGKQREHCDHGTALDDDVEQVAFFQAKRMFGKQEMPGGRNRDELGDAFNDTQQHCGDPVWHRLVKRESSAEDKPENGKRGRLD